MQWAPFRKSGTTEPVLGPDWGRYETGKWGAGRGISVEICGWGTGFWDWFFGAGREKFKKKISGFFEKFS